jgi:hypothetical protein
VVIRHAHRRCFAGEHPKACSGREEKVINTRRRF